MRHVPRRTMLGPVGTTVAAGTVGRFPSTAAERPSDPSLDASAIRGYWAATAAERGR
ncbi:hypothetical protein [Haloplanus rubicundus]|uniref:hypothetical protein n=1 Tax=Haloplanus rubicundus TaxID=1547898 RepID=UPI0013009762|nr:hypothetical protein [Haloplanus rubicundus]